MYLFCPKCNTQHPASGHCPRCSSRLLSPGEAADVLSRSAVAPTTALTSTLGRRVVVGGLVALGLHLALREWATAAASLIGGMPDGGDIWLNYALRVIGTLVGGTIAGAGRNRGVGGGAAVGGVGALAWLTVDVFPHVQYDLFRLGLAGGLAALGGVAALIGGRVWPGRVELPVPVSSRNSSLLKLKTTDGRRGPPPTRWLRVIVAVTVAVCGVIAADAIREYLGRLPKGLIQLTPVKRVDAHITGFLVLLGGLIAGASTGAAVRHGFIAAVVVGLTVLGLTAFHPDGPTPGVQYVIDLFGGADSAQQGATTAGAVAFAVVMAGGWMGGQLLPPLARRKRRLRD